MFNINKHTKYVYLTMAEQVDSRMRQFLADRKINIAQLEAKKASDSSESVVERRERLRELAIKKRVRIALIINSLH